VAEATCCGTFVFALTGGRAVVDDEPGTEPLDEEPAADELGLLLPGRPVPPPGWTFEEVGAAGPAAPTEFVSTGGSVANGSVPALPTPKAGASRGVRAPTAEPGPISSVWGDERWGVGQAWKATRLVPSVAIATTAATSEPVVPIPASVARCVACGSENTV
jgi:hypothetical protein